MTKAFKSVDIDNSGVVDWPEYVFSVMGEKALRYGTLAQMERLSGLLDESDDMLATMRSSLEESQESQAARAKRNKELMARMKNMKNDSQSQMSGILNSNNSSIFVN